MVDGVGDRVCLLSSSLQPAANGSYRAASDRHCSKPGSRSAPRITSTASPSVPDQEMYFLIHLVRHTEFIFLTC